MFIITANWGPPATVQTIFSHLKQLSLSKRQFPFHAVESTGKSALSAFRNPLHFTLPLSCSTQISQPSSQTTCLHSLFPWQVTIVKIRQIPPANTSDISIYQDDLIVSTNIPTENSLMHWCVCSTGVTEGVWFVTRHPERCWTAQTFLLYDSSRHTPLSYCVLLGNWPGSFSSVDFGDSRPLIAPSAAC